LATPGDKGRKKAQSRIKELDKQMEPMEAKRTNFEMMLNVYETQVSVGVFVSHRASED
jgi:hypothetical protein